MTEAPPIRSLVCMVCDARWVVGEPDECTCVTPQPDAWLDDPTILGAWLRLGESCRRAAVAFRALFARLDDR